MMRYLTVYNTDQEILQAISDIHLRGKWFGVRHAGIQRALNRENNTYKGHIFEELKCEI